MTTSTSNLRSVFITGSDTGIGKTRVSVALLRALVVNGIDALGMKPVASGSVDSADGLRNDDALALHAAGYRPMPYADINPWALLEPIAPHAAAMQSGMTITLDRVETAYRKLRADAEIVIVEGVGGWAVPLSETLMQAAIPQRLKLPVILVIGLRLGCINHALLTARAIVDDDCELLGWIGNRIDPWMQAVDANVAMLKQQLATPCLGILDYDSCELAETKSLVAARSILRSDPQ